MGAVEEGGCKYFWCGVCGWGRRSGAGYSFSFLLRGMGNVYKVFRKSPFLRLLMILQNVSATAMALNQTRISL